MFLMSLLQQHSPLLKAMLPYVLQGISPTWRVICFVYRHIKPRKQQPTLPTVINLYACTQCHSHHKNKHKSKRRRGR